MTPHFWLRLYDLLVPALAVLAGALLLACTFAIVGDVLLRTAGLAFLHGVDALGEYALLYVTMAAAPWLVRTHGHVAVGSFLRLLPAGWRARILGAGLATSAVLSLALAWYAAGLAAESFVRGDVDIRSIDLPRWLLFLPLAVGFLLTAVEFARLWLRGERPPVAGAGGESF